MFLLFVDIVIYFCEQKYDVKKLELIYFLLNRFYSCEVFNFNNFSLYFLGVFFFFNSFSDFVFFSFFLVDSLNYGLEIDICIIELGCNCEFVDLWFELFVEGKLKEVRLLGLLGKENVFGEYGLKLLKLNILQL